MFAEPVGHLAHPLDALLAGVVGGGPLQLAIELADDRQGQLLVAVINAYLETIGVSSGPAPRKTLAHLLRQAGAGEPLSPLARG